MPKSSFVCSVAISACYSLIAAQPSGYVIGWGDAGHFQATGNYEQRISTSAEVIAGNLLSNVTAIAAGASHCLALRDDGTVFGWGWNHDGQAVGFKTPDADRTNGFVTLGGNPLRDVVSVAAGRTFSLALKRDGTVVMWGEHREMKAMWSYAVLSNEDQTNILFEKVVTAAADPKTGPLARTNVSLVPRYTGDQEWRGSEAIRTANIEVSSDGTLVSWVDNNKTEALSNVVAIAARGMYSVALKRDGTVVSWSCMPPDAPHVPSGLSNVVAIACGGGGMSQYERSMALTKNGQLFVWKTGLPHEDAVPPEATNVIAIAAGGSYSLVLKKDGTVFGWGFNRYGQATGTPTGQAANDPHGTSGPVLIEEKVLSNVVAIAANGDYNLALKMEGTVTAWGNPRSYTPVPSGLKDVAAIAPGDGFCLAITTNYVPALPKK